MSATPAPTVPTVSAPDHGSGGERVGQRQPGGLPIHPDLNVSEPFDRSHENAEARADRPSGRPRERLNNKRLRVPAVPPGATVSANFRYTEDPAP
jgi:hypothetical protein